MVDSLFDPAADENKGIKKIYNVSWEDHLSTVTGQNSANLVFCYVKQVLKAVMYEVCDSPRFRAKFNSSIY